MREAEDQLKGVNPLRRLRLGAGDLSLRQVAALTEQAGHRIDHAALSLLERGIQTITFRHAEVLSKLYGYPIPNLMKEMAEWYEDHKPSQANPKQRHLFPAGLVGGVNRGS